MFLTEYGFTCEEVEAFRKAAAGESNISEIKEGKLEVYMGDL